MGGNNMESLLMDDSSSGESDDEVNVPMGSSTTTTAASAVNVPAPVAPVPAPAPNPAPAPAPSAPAPAARGRSSQADQMARLKSLYNISKSTGSSSTSTGGGVSSQGAPAAPKPLQRPPMQSSQRPPQQQPMQQPPSSRQRPSHPQMQQRQHQQPVGGRPMTQQQQHHQRAQLYKQSSQQVQQQQQMPSRSQPQQRQPQYSQPPAQQRQQYSQQQQQSISSRSSQGQQRSSQSQQRQPQYSQSSSQQRQQYVSQSRGGSSSQQQSQQAAVDPYAPTPLSQIKQSSHSRRTHQQQQMQSQRQSTKPMTSRMQPLQVGGSSGVNQMTPQEVKRQKEKFLMFTRVLIKYLEQKDQAMHQQAKIIIKDCAERNKRQEAGYESVTQSMKRRLKELVGEHYWKKANDYLVHFIEQKKRQAQGRGVTGSVAQQQEEVRRRKAQLVMQQRRMKEPLQQQPQQKTKQEPPNVSKQRQSVPTVAAPSIVKREQVPIEAQTTTTAKATSKTKSKSGASSKASGSESKTTAKPKTTKKTVRRKSTGDASTTSRKSTTSKTTPASSTTTTVVKRIVVEEPPREYKELMELIDHAVEYNWPQIGQLLGNKADLKLTDEERQLLYGDNAPESLTKKKALKAPTKASVSTPVAPKPVGSQDQSPSKKVSDEQNQVDVETSNKDRIRKGWGRSNVLSARAAWARVRLKELRQRKIEAANSSPVVADGLLSLPIVSQEPQEQQQQSPSATPTTTTSTPGQDTDASVTPKPVEIEGSWVNEEAAEQDKALALLSESCQIYLKGVLQKAVQCARQRQNLDGIRLWHQQYAFNKGTFGSATKSMDKSKKPPLALRLGCDVSRQAAQAQGNAALTVKRMEEALDRQTGVPMRVRELNTETLLEATSMGDLSWRPLLKKGAEKADYHAKRSFEVYGGKEAKDPPLGRVPKKAKLLVEDFVMGSELVVDGPYHKAYTASSFVSF